jgi:hypothetical protein
MRNLTLSLLVLFSATALAAPPSVTIGDASAPPGGSANVVVSFSNSTGTDPMSAGFEFRLGYDPAKLTPGVVTTLLSNVACQVQLPGQMKCLGYATSGNYPKAGTIQIPMNVMAGASGSSVLSLSAHVQADEQGEAIASTSPGPINATFTIIQLGEL